MKQPTIELKNFIDRYDLFIISGHENPDADALCSSLVLSRLLTRYGKKTWLYNAGPFTRKDIESYSDSFKNDFDLQLIIPNKTAIIITDCNSLGRIGFLGTLPEIQKLPLLIIDHHIPTETPNDPFFIDSDSPSTTLLIKRVSSLLNLPLSTEEAENLLFGFCTDTGFFKFLTQNRYQEMHEVAELLEAGGSPKNCFNRMAGGKSIGSRKMLARLLNRTEFYLNETIAISWDSLADIEEFGEGAREGDVLYAQLLAIDSVEAIFYLKQNDEKNYTLGLRGKNKINVGLIATELGGGGHRLAAGAKINGTKEEIIEKLLEMVKDPKYLI